jgi:hypothetical protein
LSTKTPLNRSLDLYMRRRRPRSLAMVKGLHEAVSAAAPVVPTPPLPPQLLPTPLPTGTTPLIAFPVGPVMTLEVGKWYVLPGSADPVLITEG